jgi:ABC-type glycerol-3-phosphate transport system substrate-binding protein
MASISKFQIIILGFFIICIIAGVAFFAMYKGNSSSTSIAPITVWGTLPADTFNSYVSKINLTLSSSISVYYVEKSQSSFSSDFIAALARGKGPDAVLIPADMLLPHLDKITMIPYTTLSQRTFMDTYIGEGQMYLTANGIRALPFLIDPLVMYWNKDMFGAAGIATYPKYWDEFSSINKLIISKDQNDNIRKSAIAMGDFSNVMNARELLGTLLMQTGNQITSQGSDSIVVSMLKASGNANPSTVVSFFSQFVDPNNANYSWNRGMPDSKTAFLSGIVATYFGFASELGDIRSKNPNLSFDVASIPQFRSSNTKTTYGRMYGLSIVSQSVNQNAAYQILAILTNPSNLALLSQMTYLPSVNTSIIAGGSTDPYITIFNKASLIAKSWIDADSSQSYRIFGNMIGAITSGAKTVNEALYDANDQYNVVLRQAQQ